MTPDSGRSIETGLSALAACFWPRDNNSFQSRRGAFPLTAPLRIDSRANGCRYVSQNFARMRTADIEKNCAGIHARVDGVYNSPGLAKQSSKGMSVARQFPGNGLRG